MGCFFLVSQTFSQENNSVVKAKRFELGFELHQNLVLCDYESISQGIGYVPKKVWGCGLHDGSDKNRSFGIYMKYRMKPYLVIEAGIAYSHFLKNEGNWFHLNYNDSQSYVFAYSYYTENIDFPVSLKGSLFNKRCVSPYLLAGFRLRIDVREKTLVRMQENRFYSDHHWRYADMAGVVGVGVDFRIKKMLKLGTEVSFTSPQFWMTNASLLTDVKYSLYSFGIHLGYIL